MLHDFVSAHRGVSDFLAWVLAGVSVAGALSQVAIVVTILSGLGSLSLVWLRWRQHLKGGDL